jgi:putative hydrolase of the HAD superfamily
MSIRAVIFDFGGVLCFHPTADQIAEAARACELPVPEFLHAFWSNRLPYDAGELAPQAYWSAVAKTAGRTFDDDLVTGMIKREIDFWSRYDDRVIAWARQLRTSGLRTGMLSNMPEPLGSHLRATRTLLDDFDHVTLSYELRITKPQAEIYEDAIRGLSVAPAEALFLDDRLENVAGAKAVGLHAEVYESWEQFEKEALGRYNLPAPEAAARRQ